MEFHNSPVVRITQASNPLFQKCHIHHFSGNGFFIGEKGAGTIEDCDISHFKDYPAILY